MYRYLDTCRFKVLFALLMSGAQLGLWIVSELPIVLLTALIIVQWLPLSEKRSPAGPSQRRTLCFLAAGILTTVLAGIMVFINRGPGTL